MKLKNQIPNKQNRNNQYCWSLITDDLKLDSGSRLLLQDCTSLLRDFMCIFAVVSLTPSQLCIRFVNNWPL